MVLNSVCSKHAQQNENWSTHYSARVEETKQTKKKCFAIYRYKSSATQHKMFFLVFTYPKIIHCFLFFVSYEDMSQAQIRAEGLQKYN